MMSQISACKRIPKMFGFWGSEPDVHDVAGWIHFWMMRTENGLVVLRTRPIQYVMRGNAKSFFAGAGLLN